MSLKRLPRPALRPFVSLLWASQPDNVDAPTASAREHVLPGGEMHLVFRLSENPLRIFSDAVDRQGHCLTTAMVGGARTAYYIKDVSEPARSVGAMLRPGAAALLFGVPASDLADRHTSLCDLWGPEADSARSRLLEANDPEQRLDVLENLLAKRLPLVTGLHPVEVRALTGFHQQQRVEALVRDSGYSHRHFNALFRDAVGVAPKAYFRVQQFRNALGLLASGSNASLASIAYEAGYSDHAHLSRTFAEMAGVTPSTYRRWTTGFSHHLRLPTRDQ